MVLGQIGADITKLIERLSPFLSLNRAYSFKKKTIHNLYCLFKIDVLFCGKVGYKSPANIWTGKSWEWGPIRRDGWGFELVAMVRSWGPGNVARPGGLRYEVCWCTAQWRPLWGGGGVICLGYCWYCWWWSEHVCCLWCRMGVKIQLVGKWSIGIVRCVQWDKRMLRLWVGLGNWFCGFWEVCRSMVVWAFVLSGSGLMEVIFQRWFLV